MPKFKLKYKEGDTSNGTEYSSSFKTNDEDILNKTKELETIVYRFYDFLSTVGYNRYDVSNAIKKYIENNLDEELPDSIKDIIEMEFRSVEDFQKHISSEPSFANFVFDSFIEGK